MNLICEKFLEQIVSGELTPEVCAHLDVCEECKALANDVQFFMEAPLPPPARTVPPTAVDAAIRTAARTEAHAAEFRMRLRTMIRIAVPAAAAFAVCGLLFLHNTERKNPYTAELSLPTQATLTGDWTGTEMDGRLAEVTFGLENTLDNMTLSEQDVLLAQLEADFAEYLQ